MKKFRTNIGEEESTAPADLAFPRLMERKPDPGTEKRLRALLSDPAELNGSDDRVIEQLYGLLKADAVAEDVRKRRFKKTRGHVKRLVGLDKRRTKLRYVRRAGKYLAISAFIATFVSCLVTGYRPYFATELSDVLFVLEYDLQRLQDAPEVALCFLLFLLGVAMYIGARTAISNKDRRLVRRIVCKAVAEELSVTEIIRLKRSAVEIGVEDISAYHPLKELCQPDEDPGG